MGDNHTTATAAAAAVLPKWLFLEKSPHHLLCLPFKSGHPQEFLMMLEETQKWPPPLFGINVAHFSGDKSHSLKTTAPPGSSVRSEVRFSDDEGRWTALSTLTGSCEDV